MTLKFFLTLAVMLSPPAPSREEMVQTTVNFMQNQLCIKLNDGEVKSLMANEKNYLEIIENYYSKQIPAAIIKFSPETVTYTNPRNAKEEIAIINLHRDVLDKVKLQDKKIVLLIYATSTGHNNPVDIANQRAPNISDQLLSRNYKSNNMLFIGMADRSQKYKPVEDVAYIYRSLCK